MGDTGDYEKLYSAQTLFADFIITLRYKMALKEEIKLVNIMQERRDNSGTNR